MQNVDTAYVFTVVLPYIKIGEVGFKEKECAELLLNDIKKQVSTDNITESVDKD